MGRGNITRLELSQHMKIGIIGCTNVGKSSFFNAFAGVKNIRNLSEVKNSLFTTVDNNCVTIEISDSRIDQITTTFPTIVGKKKYLTLIDTPGIIKNSRNGAGVGITGLDAIRNVDIILHIVRGFDDNELTVTYEGTVDAERDLRIVEQELMLEDLLIIDNTINVFILEIENKNGGKELRYEYDLLLKAYEILVGEPRPPLKRKKGVIMRPSFPSACRGKPLRFGDFDTTEVVYLKKYNFFTAKEVLYLVNLTPRDFMRKSTVPVYISKMREMIGPNSYFLPMSAVFETSLFEEELAGTLSSYLEANPTHISVIPAIIEECYRRLNLIHFYTIDNGEAQSWLTTRGSQLIFAGTVISDLHEKNFLSGDVCTVGEYCNGEGDWMRLLKEGIAQNRSAKYNINDGDIVRYRLRDPITGKSKKLEEF